MPDLCRAFFDNMLLSVSQVYMCVCIGVLLSFPLSCRLLLTSMIFDFTGFSRDWFFMLIGCWNGLWQVHLSLSLVTYLPKGAPWLLLPLHAGSFLACICNLISSYFLFTSISIVIMTHVLFKLLCSPSPLRMLNFSDQAMMLRLKCKNSLW